MNANSPCHKQRRSVTNERFPMRLKGRREVMEGGRGKGATG